MGHLHNFFVMVRIPIIYILELEDNMFFSSPKLNFHVEIKADLNFLMTISFQCATKDSLIHTIIKLHSISGGWQVSREDLVGLPALGVGGCDQRSRRIESAHSVTGQHNGVGQGDAGLLVSPVVARSIGVVCNNLPISAPSTQIMVSLKSSRNLQITLAVVPIVYELLFTPSMAVFASWATESCNWRREVGKFIRVII
jgi:hypothetical protein